MGVSENRGTPKSSILNHFNRVFHYKPSIGFKHFLFPLLPGEMIQFDSYFSGWNHQLVTHLNSRECVISHYFMGSSKLKQSGFRHGSMVSFLGFENPSAISLSEEAPVEDHGFMVWYPEGSGYI